MLVHECNSVALIIDDRTDRLVIFGLVAVDGPSRWLAPVRVLILIRQ